MAYNSEIIEWPVPMATSRERSVQKDSAAEIQRLTKEISALRCKRDSVIDSFVEGVLKQEERDRRLTTIDSAIRLAQDSMAEKVGDKSLTVEDLIEAFSTLTEWGYWSREQKRSVLSTLVPEIRVADYQIDSLGLNPLIFSNEVTQKAAGNFIAERFLVYLPLKTCRD